MIIAALSDMHGALPDPASMPVCDILLIGGDICPVKGGHGTTRQTYWLKDEFKPWLASVPARHIVGIAGNHDFIFKTKPSISDDLDLGWHYLMNSGIIVDGVRIWGSPYTPQFGNWAFMKTEFEIGGIWANIPLDTEILLTHGPPLYILDKSGFAPFGGTNNAGSRTLLNRIEYGGFKYLRHNVFGHIHEAYGHEKIGNIDFWNVSMMDENYDPTNPIVIIEDNKSSSVELNGPQRPFGIGQAA